MNQNYCIIMAGGIGSRFWPLSRTSRPKQFLDILGTGETFIQQTFRRLNKICPAENFFVVTNADYKEMVLDQLPELNESQVLCEPLRRNTAPCIAYATYRIKKQVPDANIIVAPSDHVILKESEFIETVNRGLRFVESHKALLTLGIKPSRPETGYGYIQTAENVQFEDEKGLCVVKTFTEKPDLKMAKVFLDSGDFFWNSGIFIWSLSAIIEALDAYLPDVSELFSKGMKLYNTPDEEAFLNKTYPECPNISIDYGIMEKANNVYVLCSDFGWSDLGTWGSLWDNSVRDENNNALTGDNLFIYDSINNVINMPDGKLAVIQGLDGYIVVESDNTLLICRKDNEQQIRQYVNDVRSKRGERFV